MLDALYQDGTNRVLDDMQQRPGRASESSPGFWSGIWSAAPKGAASGGLKAGAAQANIAEAFGTVVGAFDPFGATIINRTDPEKAKQERAAALKRIEDNTLLQSDMADELRRVARERKPDPTTTGFAGQALFGVSDFVTQAGASYFLGGPLASMGGVGVSEGGATFDELRQQGVDATTATKVAAVRGVTAAATVALPVAGKTWAQTGALAAAGGPGTYVAENLAAREILKAADYSKQAEQFDPFDPLGLTVATGAAFLFGAGAMAMRGKGVTPGPRPTQDQVDAAHVVVQREVADQQALAKPGDLAADAADHAARDRAETQLAAGERVNVADVAPVREGEPLPPQIAEMAQKVERAIIPQAKDLAPADRAIEQRMAADVQNVDEAATRYAALKDSNGGKVLNTDVARELSPDYLRDRTKSAAVHEPASWLIKRLYERKLAEAPKGDEAPMVLFTAGGTGAGKTSAIDGLPALKAAKDVSQIVYDTNMNTYDSSKAKIEQALAAGKEVTIAWVYRDPVDALTGGALPRAERQAKEFGSGRTVPLAEHLKTHKGVAEVIPRLAAEYADDPRVMFIGVDNSKGKGNQAIADLAALTKKAQNSPVDVDKLRAALEKEREAGRISEQTYRGFADQVPDGSRAQGDAAQGAVAVDRAGDGGKPEGSQPGGGSAEAVDPAVAAAEQAARANPSLEVELPDGTRVTAAEALRLAQEQARAEVADANLLQVAAACALTV
jgi:hypothetical protein